MRLVWSKIIDGSPHFVNVQEFQGRKEKYVERGQKSACLEKYHHKVNADITQIRQKSSNLYKEHGPTGTVQGQRKRLA